jgi:hypothetical protein
MGIAARLASLITDRRNPLLVTHSVADILCARMLAIACGYEDADDLDHLRTDPGFKLACGRLPDSGSDLCSQPTVSRWENAPDLRAVIRMSYALVDIYCASYRRPPRAVTLDIDDTVDVVHGEAGQGSSGEANGIARRGHQMHLEGIICKQADAPYRSGRWRSWVKLKCSGREEPARRHYDPEGRLHYAGGVGTGFFGAGTFGASQEAEGDEGRPACGNAGIPRYDRRVRPPGGAGTGHRGAVHRLVGCGPCAPSSLSGDAGGQVGPRGDPSCGGSGGGGARGVFPAPGQRQRDNWAQGLAWDRAAGEAAGNGRGRNRGSDPPVLGRRRASTQESHLSMPLEVFIRQLQMVGRDSRSTVQESTGHS